MYSFVSKHMGSIILHTKKGTKCFVKNMVRPLDRRMDTTNQNILVNGTSNVPETVRLMFDCPNEDHSGRPVEV